MRISLNNVTNGSIKKLQLLLRTNVQNSAKNINMFYCAFLKLKILLELLHCAIWRIFMASTYTHYVFARDVLNQLDTPIKTIIEKNRQLYDIGCHGSDLLFYYYPLKKTELRTYGYNLHEKKAMAFFNECVSLLKEKNGDEASLAYALGFVTHYALDINVHGYVERMAQNHPDKDFTHGTIEVEFDRYLLVKEGKDPLRSTVIPHIVSSKKNASVIAPFFPLANTKAIKTSLDSMIFFCNIFNAPSVLKRRFVYFALKIFGNYDAFSSQIFSFNGDNRCIETNKEMERRYTVALPVAVELIKNFYDAVVDGTSLSEKFNKTFSWEDNE